MKFSIKKELLLQNLNSVSKALSNKNLIPILSGIKFNLNNEGLFLSASDNDISIECFIKKEKLETIEKLIECLLIGAMGYLFLWVGVTRWRERYC